MIKKKIKSIIQFITNPRLILCFGLAWIITNGWSYIMFAVGTYFQIGWMIAVSGAYLAFLWLPVSPEKLVTVAISIVLLRFLFPNDKKTLGKLRELREKFRLERKKRSDKKIEGSKDDGKENPT